MKNRVLIAIPLLIFLLASIVFSALPCFESTIWHDIPLLLFITLFTSFCIYEFAHVFAKNGSRPLSLPAYVLTITHAFVLYFLGTTAFVIEYFVCIIASVIGLVLRRRNEHSSMIVSMYFYIYPIAFLSSAALTFTYFSRPYGLLGLCIILLVPIFTDTFAYFGGYFFGRHKLIPEISPKKTIEGAVFGIIGGTLLSILLIIAQQLIGADLKWYYMLPICFIVSVLCQFGDLFASMFKRWANVKDYSNLFQNHGGAMDRSDSIMFSAPIVFCCFLILNYFKVI